YYINKKLNRKGSVWKTGYYNRYIRNVEHLVSTYYYILNNPIKAGLVKEWKQHKYTFGNNFQ
ncbi:MAG: hypothetical protein AAFO07_30970, partial [Bacteroidota bacterium]